jgi:hypothetical protein
MFSEDTRQKITRIWNTYIEANKQVLDTKGRVINNIDVQRATAIKEIREMMSALFSSKVNISQFKTSLDGYNKRNNLWGFTAAKGQMFFNQLVKANEQNLPKLLALFRNTLVEPRNLKEATEKLDEFEKFVRTTFAIAVDKRKAPNPGSVGYFLSYFWQVQNPVKWPIIYTSLTNAFSDLGIWKDHNTQSSAYEDFYNLNEEVKAVLSTHAKSIISNWDLEHAFWLLRGNPRAIPEKRPKRKSGIRVSVESPIIQLSSSFVLSDYLIPKVAGLVKLGNATNKSKGSQFEKLVAEIFKLLDFDVQDLGQGRGRNPDAILRFREENTAFIVDAKAYSDGYSMGVDDRAIKEYISHHCPVLKKEGYTKIGFIIVSNFFKSNLESFINEITWNTEIKRFILLESEALLYLLAYKMKDKRDLPTIIERLVSMGNLVTASNVIEKFDDI